MGVLGFEQLDVEALMAGDEAVASTIDALRRQQVQDTIVVGREG
jgi:hypothetical protein